MNITTSLVVWTQLLSCDIHSQQKLFQLVPFRDRKVTSSHLPTFLWEHGMNNQYHLQQWPHFHLLMMNFAIAGINPERSNCENNAHTSRCEMTHVTYSQSNKQKHFLTGPFLRSEGTMCFSLSLTESHHLSTNPFDLFSHERNRYSTKRISIPSCSCQDFLAFLKIGLIYEEAGRAQLKQVQSLFLTSAYP